VWIGSVDGRSPVRQLTDKDALVAFFGADGDIVFASNEADGHYLYRIATDGAPAQKLTQVFTIYSVSPDGRWVSGWLPPTPPNSVSLIPTINGSPILVCEACYTGGTFESGVWAPPISWSPDARFIYVKFKRATYAVPLQDGQMLPRIPPTGFTNEQEVAQLPGARRIGDGALFTGSNPSMYAVIRVSTQRNIYRVPVR
jgi:hypothetical protein